MAVKAMEYVPEKRTDDDIYDFMGPEKRWCIMDEDTGEILDDAQGWGYKTPQKAYAAWNYKHRDTSKDTEKRRKTELIKEWMRQNRDFVQMLEWESFDILKGQYGPDAKFDTEFVRRKLKEYGHTDLKFTAYELLRVYCNGSLCPDDIWKNRKKNRKKKKQK